MTAQNDSVFMRAVRGEPVLRTPFWFMRQAGRVDPEYRRLRDEAGLPLEELFRHPGWAARISLLPARWGVDALIFFQDILTPLGPMGAPFVFAPGPKLDASIRTRAQIDALHGFDPAAELPFVAETFAGIRAEQQALPVLGFAGAPLTLLFFLVEGGSFKDGAPHAHALLREAPETAQDLLDKLTAMTIAYLDYQADCGAAAVQLFESAAHLVDAAQYRTFALPAQQRIFAALKGRVPAICFAREWADLDTLGASGADIVSLPAGVTINQARAHWGPDAMVQGNLDNRLLAAGPVDAVLAQARAILEAGGRRGHIFNLSHGLLPETPYEHLLALIEFLKTEQG